MTLKRKVGDKAKVVDAHSGHPFAKDEVVSIFDFATSGYYVKSGSSWSFIDERDLTDCDPIESKPLTPDEFYQKTMQLCKLETLVEKIDETDTRSLTTSGADFLDEVKRLIEEIKVQLGLPKV